MTAKPPPKITASYIENAALHYLERFASSRANLKRVLMRKVDRSLAHWGGDRDASAQQVDTVIAKLAGLGYVDDARFAEAKAASLHRRGTSPRMIRALLAAKGVDADTATAGLAALDAEDLELAAAVNLARRRRLGPFRPPETRAAWRERDTATLARAGFAWEVVRRVVEAEDDAALAQP